MKRKVLSRIILIVVLLVNILALASNPVQVSVKADPATAVYLNPCVNVVKPNQNVTINIEIANVGRLNAWEFRLRFDPAVLYTDESLIEEGSFLQNVGPTFFCASMHMYAFVYYIVVGAALREPKSSNGSGTLAAVTFEVRGEMGDSTSLDLYDTILFDVDLNPISHMSDDGVVSIESSPPVLASFNFSKAVVNHKEVVTFDASASFCNYYKWDFGDGNVTTTTTPIITHSYPTMGTYLVNLTVGLDINMTVVDVESEQIFIRMPTCLSVTTGTSSMYVGFQVNISGTLRDWEGNGVGEANIVLSYSVPGVSTWSIITSAITDPEGFYSAIWITPATGYFTIKAEYPGNLTYVETSDSATLSVLPFEEECVFSVESNSTVSALAFNTTDWTLSFTAIGPNGTIGYVKVTVAKSLVTNPANVRVYLDGNQTEYSIISIDDSWLLTFTYMHSAHQVAVDLDIDIIPEFPSFVSMALFIIATLLAAIVYRRKHAM